MNHHTQNFQEPVVRVFAVFSTISLLVALIGINDGAISAKRPAGTIVLPFVWRDVAAVCLLSTAPLAWMVGRILSSRFRKWQCCLFAALLLVFVWGLLVRFQEIDGPLKELPVFPGTMRLVAAFCVTVGTALVTQTVINTSVDHRRNDRQTIFLRAVSGLTLLALVPRIYLDARGHHDAEQFVSLREQSRLGEAGSLLRRMVILDPAIRIDGQLLRREQPELERNIDLLRRQTRNELPAAAVFDQHLERARGLAMLGLTEDTIRILLEKSETFQNVEACSLLGTVYENRLDWSSALRFYGMADQLLTSSPESPATAAQSYQIAMGSAYCYRRLGRLSEARTQYLSLLKFGSNADTHFLLARFFEDIQETGSARHHAEAAMQLAPMRYGVKGRELIRKMQVLHFRCLSVYGHSATPE